jgi:hypothetical protein
MSNQSVIEKKLKIVLFMKLNQIEISHQNYQDVCNIFQVFYGSTSQNINFELNQFNPFQQNFRSSNLGLVV